MRILHLGKYYPPDTGGIESINASLARGAVAAGMSRLGWVSRPSAMHELQAAAAVGQMGLVQAWESSFAQHGRHTAQILLTHDDLSDRKRYLNARSTLRTRESLRSSMSASKVPSAVVPAPVRRASISVFQ